MYAVHQSGYINDFFKKRSQKLKITIVTADVYNTQHCTVYLNVPVPLRKKQHHWLIAYSYTLFSLISHLHILQTSKVSVVRKSGFR